MGLFGKPKKQEELINGFTKEHIAGMRSSLATSIGTSDLDAVLETFAPNTAKQIDLNLQLSMKIIDWIKVVIEQNKEIKAQNQEIAEELKTLKEENLRLRNERQPNVVTR